MDVRADQLQQSYVSKARNTDRVYCGTAEGAIGTVKRKFVSMICRISICKIVSAVNSN